MIMSLKLPFTRLSLYFFYILRKPRHIQFEIKDRRQDSVAFILVFRRNTHIIPRYCQNGNKAAKQLWQTESLSPQN